MILRRQIIAAVADRLAALPDVAQVEVQPDGDPDDFPALRVFDDGQSVEEGEASSTRYALKLSVEGWVQGDDAYDALNDLYAETVSALLTEPPLGGLAETIDEGGLRVEVGELAATPSHKFAQDFTISFATRRGDPATPA